MRRAILRVPTLLPPDLATISGGDWAVHEIGHAALGDARRTARAVRILAAFGDQPNASVSEAMGSPAAAKAAYCLFENDDAKPEVLRTAHHQSTAARTRNEEIVLVLHDTTELDWTSHPATTGLGPLSAPSHQGLHVHSSFAVTTDGVPLGLLNQIVWARDPETRGIAEERRTRAFDDKESAKWTTGIAASADVVGPGPRLIHIGDQESDVYDVVRAALERGDEIVLRACQNRRTDEPGRLSHDVVAAAPAAGTRTIQVGRAPNRPARDAELTLRWTTLTVLAPKYRYAEKLPPVTVTAVLVEELDPLAGSEAIRWLLITTVPTTSVEEAWERVRWYALRWRIERYHYVLKSGFRMEERQFQTAERLERVLAFAAIVAWRVLFLTYVGREAAAEPARWLTPAQGRILWAATHPKDPGHDTPLTNREAVRALGRLGGFMGRRHDGEPGAKVLWRGVQRFTLICLGVQLAPLLLDFEGKE